MNRVLFTLVTVMILLGACATPDSSSTASAPRDEKVYRTGSNIPSRESSADNVKTVDPNALPAMRSGGKGG